MDSNFYILFVLYPKKGNKNPIRAYPYVSAIDLDKENNKMRVKCFNSEEFVVNEIDKITLLLIRGTTHQDKYYYYNILRDSFIPNDLITIGLMEFSGSHPELKDRSPLDYNMNLKHNSFEGSLGNWLLTQEALEFNDLYSLKTIIKETQEDMTIGSDKV